MRAFFMLRKVRAQRGTVIATTLLRKTLRHPEHKPVRRSNFIEIKETGRNEKNQSALINRISRSIDGC